MSLLLENPLPIAVVGGLVTLVALLVFLSRRNTPSLVVLAAIVALVVMLLVVERVVVTDAEQIEFATLAIGDAIEANDAAGVIEYTDPAAEKIRADVQALMPVIKWTVANPASIEVTLNEGTDPATASSQFRAFLQGIHQASGQQVPYINQRVDMTWVKRGDRWLMSGYTAYYNDRAIDAVSSASANRPVQ